MKSAQIREGDIILTHEGEYAIVTNVADGTVTGRVCNRPLRFVHVAARQVTQRWRGGRSVY